MKDKAWRIMQKIAYAVRTAGDYLVVFSTANGTVRQRIQHTWIVSR